MSSNTNNHSGRTRLLVQPAIVKLYRVIGIAALCTIVVGLLAFMTANIFYYFNRTWVRPIILSPTHEKVVEVSTVLNEARLRVAELESERDTARASMAQIDRLIPSNEKFESDAIGFTAKGMNGADSVLVRREIDRSVLERSEAVDRKVILAARVRVLDARIAEQNKLVDHLAKSPYVLSKGEQVVVGFVPYDNLVNVRPGVELYGCEWGLVRCRKVGKVLSRLSGEVKDTHPHDNSAQRGIMFELQLSDAQAAEQNVLFAGSKPLWLL
jgi:hypothetical protein